MGKDTGIKHYKSNVTTGYFRYTVKVELEFFGDGKPQTRNYIEHLACEELENGAREHYLDLRIEKQPIEVHGMDEVDKL
jgi:hypothetical protein